MEKLNQKDNKLLPSKLNNEKATEKLSQNTCVHVSVYDSFENVTRCTLPN